MHPPETEIWRCNPLLDPGARRTQHVQVDNEHQQTDRDTPVAAGTRLRAAQRHRQYRENHGGKRDAHTPVHFRHLLQVVGL